ncbi:MAG: KpsF/GutQ family sugar-phosphate isomerase [Halobacteriota archaeon]
MDILEEAKKVLEIEMNSIGDSIKKLDTNFVNAVELMFECKGRIIVMGMGKSGLVGRKIASTLASTGTPSLFLDPAEGLHGDLGAIMRSDIVLTISNSGATEEILKIVPNLKKMGTKIILLTGRPISTLANFSDIVIDVGVEREACPFNLAPTASSTTTLAMGDALAVVLLKKRGFGLEDFAFLHPGGHLGKKLLLKVDDVMHSGEDNPVISEGKSMKDAVIEITSKQLGAVSVVNDKGTIVGIITDGDLRRAIEKYDNLLEKRVKEIMTKNPIVIESGKLAAEAVHIMEDRPSQIMVLPVVDKERRPIGMLRIHDLVKEGVA